MGFPPKVYQFLVGTFAALGSFLYGYDLTIVAEGKPVQNPSSRRFAGTDKSFTSCIQWFILELFQPYYH